MQQKVRILPQERLDLPDLNNMQDFVCAEFQALTKLTKTDQNLVVGGFECTGTSSTTLSIALAGSAAMYGEDNGAVYMGAASLSNLTTDALTPNATNYIEISLKSDTGGADSRAFWDKTANGGDGGEFSQIVDTFTFIEANVDISVSNFSGSPDRLKICEVDVDITGIITEIRDSRNMMFRLGTADDPLHTFPWATRIEPANTVFTGADKDIKNQKQHNDAVMSLFKEITGNPQWFMEPNASLNDLLNNYLSVLSAATTSAKFAWSGTQLEITDGAGAPNDTDTIALIRMFTKLEDLELTRQVGGNAITLDDGDVLWVELPSPLTNKVYNGVGATSANYRISPRGSVPEKASTYWLAYREGVKLFVRGLGELEPNEAKQVGDETPEALRSLLGFDPEVDTTIGYVFTPNPVFANIFTIGSPLREAIEFNTGNINDIAAALFANAYDETIEVIAGVPSNSREIQGPVAIDDIITLALDSRDGDSTEQYVVGAGILEVYLNGQYLINNDDWEDVGVVDTLSTDIKIKRVLEVGDKLQLRIDTTGGFAIGGATTGTLQDVYNNGRTITIASGQPVLIQGPNGEKLFRVLGDVEITGLLDPSGLQLTRQGSNPLAVGMDGIYTDSNGDLISVKNGVIDVNISQSAGGAGSAAALADSFDNNSGGTLNKATPVRIDSLGELQTVNVATESEIDSLVGILLDDVDDAETGSVITSGRLENITIADPFGSAIFLSKTGGLTATKPSVGVGGFASGDFVVRLGTLVKNKVTPSNKDLLIRVQIVGQLA